MFGGYGNIQPLLRSNKKLLRKKSMFNNELSPSDKKQELRNLNRGKLSFEKTSNYQLNKLKKEIRLKIREDEKIFKISTLLVITIFSLAFTFLYKHYNNANDKIIQNNTITKQLEYDKIYLPKLNFVIQDGDKWLSKKYYKNAIHQYSKALEYYPNNPIAKEKLKLAYIERCKNVNIDCDKVN